ncbi:glycosyltransferase family 4 protein [Mucilaginibacter sp. SP1R1]|uniref:glycosyltransferase family 4 protein n=1 Tax=Mucilaginibacter sp. SP1R1 TaxID=2723091 RepID=UPI00160DCB3D|nr:glycosyltransferase family 4 protein [Mucilaginibacter sp. SP1R1]MBB6149847.1 glycosyltransferase involved in cell wall biosynthesis [Mucilaginibacter sp. SP1R1]
MKKKILISAYAISPVRGSEYGAAWNTVTHLASQHELWVLYGMSDDHMGDTQTLKKYIQDTPLPSVTFIEVKGGRLANSINLLNKIGLGWFFYFAYYLWQKRALKAAREVLNTVDIDVVHQLGPIGFREPGFLKQLNKPIVWGPIGGMNIISRELLKDKPFLTRLKFSVKNAINHYQLNYSKRIKEAFSDADVLIAATAAGQQTIQEKFGAESYYLPEQGIITNTFLDETKFEHVKQQVQLVWSGSLIERKNLDMCLDALAGIKHPNWMLHILGTGPLALKMRQKADRLKLTNHIIWHGHIPRKEAVRVMAGSHLHMITSMAEDNPAVIFEALTYGVPTLTIDHCGMGNVICDNCGFKVPLETYDAMVNNMTDVLNDLLKNPGKLLALAQTTLQCADEHSWYKRLSKLNSMYSQAILAHGRRFNSSSSTLVQTSLTA